MGSAGGRRTSEEHTRLFTGERNLPASSAVQFGEDAESTSSGEEMRERDSLEKSSHIQLVHRAA